MSQPYINYNPINFVMQPLTNFRHSQFQTHPSYMPWTPPFCPLLAKTSMKRARLSFTYKGL